jgi:hypothetical protein
MGPKLQAAAATAGAPQQQPAAAAAKKAVPPVELSEAELSALPARELKALLAERGVPFADCFEKADLVRKVIDRCTRVTHYV